MVIFMTIVFCALLVGVIMAGVGIIGMIRDYTDLEMERDALLEENYELKQTIIAMI